VVLRTRPSILTGLFSALGVWYWFLPPSHSWIARDRADLYGMLGFVLFSGAIIALGESNRRGLAEIIHHFYVVRGHTCRSKYLPSPSPACNSSPQISALAALLPKCFLLWPAACPLPNISQVHGDAEGTTEYLERRKTSRGKEPSMRKPGLEDRHECKSERRMPS
jgi:hypothetical protein